LRAVSSYFTLIFLAEITLLLGLLSWSYKVTNGNEIERVRAFSETLAAFGTILLTSSLVYHEFWQRPELRILDTIVDPIDANLKNIADADYAGSIYFAHPELSKDFVAKNQTRPKKVGKFLKVKSTRECARIRVSTDVCNVGVAETTIREYEISQLKPIRRIIGVYDHEITLPHEKRTSLLFYYPETASSFLEGGIYEFKITARASTQKKSKTITLNVSDDRKTIKWRQLDC